MGVRHFYHLTKEKNVKDILKGGLIPSKRRGLPPYIKGDRGFVWMFIKKQDAERANSFYNHKYTILRIVTSYLEKRKLQIGEYAPLVMVAAYSGTIPSGAISEVK